MFRPIARLATQLLAALILATSLQLPAAADISDGDRAAFNKMIEEYIRANPEVVREALISLAEREEQDRRQEAMVILQDDAGDPVLGNPDGSFVVYEFSDYNCGYCKRVFEPLMELIGEDGDIRLVVKEFPILSQSSMLAAQAGIAAQAQGIFPEFHIAMMTSRGAITMDSILAGIEHITTFQVLLALLRKMHMHLLVLCNQNNHMLDHLKHCKAFYICSSSVSS